MVKLIRMIADKSKSNSIISNTFNPSFIIEPYSRIALQSVNANLLRPSNDVFVITTFNKLFQIDGNMITIPEDEYDIGTFTSTMILMMTLQGVTSGSPGINLDITDANKIFTFVKYACPLLEPADDWPDWSVITGTPDLTNGGVFDANGSVDEVLVSANYRFPNSSYTFSGTIASVDDIRFGVFEEGNERVVIEIDNTNQYVIYYPDGNGGTATLNTATAAQINDPVSIVKIGSNLTFTYGTNTHNVTLTIEDAISSSSYTNELIIYASAGSTAAITTFEFTLIDQNQTSNRLQTSPTTLTVVFNSESLARYCGFNTLTPPARSGDPAMVTANGPVKGDPIAPGVMVCLDPFILESYDGDGRTINGKRSKGQNNILYVLQSSNPDIVQQESFPIPLGIRNKSEMQINELRITFRDQTNGEILQFNGEPSVVLVIYGPDER